MVSRRDFCSTDTQCKTFELGECIRPTDTVNIGWLQGDPDIDERPGRNRGWLFVL